MSEAERQDRRDRTDAEAGAALHAGLSAVALFDASALSRLIGDGPDLVGLLQRLSTADLTGLRPGAGRATVLTSAKGRIVDRLFLHPLGDSGTLVLAGTGRAAAVLDHIGRYTFAEATGLRDASGTTAQWSLTGPRATDALEAALLPRPPHGTEAEGRLAGARVWVVGHDGAGGPGASIVVPADAGDAAAAALHEAAERVGGRRVDAATVDLLRILHGVPVAGAELTGEWNPLEAGLADAVSFSKGCYVGQEVVARLQNYDKVARRLLGIEFAGPPPEPGATLRAGGRDAGVLTRVRRMPGARRWVGLAFVKTRHAGPGDRLETGDGVEGLLLETPFPDALVHSSNHPTEPES